MAQNDETSEQSTTATHRLWSTIQQKNQQQKKHKQNHVQQKIKNALCETIPISSCTTGRSNNDKPIMERNTNNNSARGKTKITSTTRKRTDKNFQDVIIPTKANSYSITMGRSSGKPDYGHKTNKNSTKTYKGREHFKPVRITREIDQILAVLEASGQSGAQLIVVQAVYARVCRCVCACICVAVFVCVCKCVVGGAYKMCCTLGSWHSATGLTEVMPANKQLQNPKPIAAETKSERHQKQTNNRQTNGVMVEVRVAVSTRQTRIGVPSYE